MRAKYKVGEIITLKPGVYMPIDIESYIDHGPALLDDFTDAIIEDVQELSHSVYYFVKVINGKFTNRIAWVYETHMMARGSYCDEDIDVVDISELL